MSKGPGRIMRAVMAAADAERGKPLLVQELCHRVYPQAAATEKKHRVAVIRAMRALLRERGDLTIEQGSRAGSPCPLLILFHRADRRAVVAQLRENRIWLQGDHESWRWILDQIHAEAGLANKPSEKFLAWLEQRESAEVLQG